ncbi:MAG: hypothetical protein NTZ09_07335 [Candidatus Hydrogenedentes bacterium]|nr:hypothetical protein [Candidatus Hydrogenedentota bacterium]
MDRRDFIQTSLTASAGAAFGWNFEERVLLAQAEGRKPAPAPASPPAASAMPTGKLGDLTVSRLICGGNLISGIAHSRDLVYVSPLVAKYNTTEKILETLELAEKCGINTVFLRDTQQSVNIMSKYWRERGGGMQWIAQAEDSEDGIYVGIRRSIDGGAAGVCIQGEAADQFVLNGQFDLLAEAYGDIERAGVLAGIGAHRLEVLLACREHGLKPQFFLKTFNSKSYWSAGPKPRNDSVWEETPKETAEFMASSEAPWVAFKVLGAGAIMPQEGFQYAFSGGADFIVVGMFDFQIEEDVRIAKQVLSGDLKRTRSWKT